MKSLGCPQLPALIDDSNDLLVFTPGHFLIGDRLTAIPQINVQDTPPNRLSCYNWFQAMTQHYWKRWSNEYLESS
ncbi:hypothetical protein NQ314_016632 [Rhamnusium bicolor]|uniref:DUF5641 domain-containing protein n=1 Tax=Rhamnusium bicolor TaxID=1586634 RepID=A0AAV8WY60_9CUCU|nr:hypothetical protein NQ314_016632 [Rhamnusium bicolor]